LNDLMKNILLWVVIAVVLMSVFQNINRQADGTKSYAYSEFLDQVESGQIEKVVIDSNGREITGKLKSGEAFSTYSPETDNQALIGDLHRQNVEIIGKEPSCC
jgi:cell division protease FtsH